jgi:hypothetical protein
MAVSQLLALFLSACAVAASEADTIQFPIAASPPSSSSDPVPNNFQSFSIELAFWADYAGGIAFI